jgi:hypothetical protein
MAILLFVIARQDSANGDDWKGRKPQKSLVYRVAIAKRLQDRR